MILSDFHIHSNFSDGKHSIPEIVDFYGLRGFGAIAITDHLCEEDTFLGKAAGYLERTLTPATFPIYLEILKSEAERAWKKYKMVLIPGVEITKNSFSNHRSAHILGLGISEWVKADSSIEEILKTLRDQGAVTVAAHPISSRKFEKQTLHLWDRKEELRTLVDAWEVGSGLNFYNEVAKSGMPMIANTDLHRFSQMTGWKSVIDARPSQSAILKAIRKQKISFQFYEENHDPVPFPSSLALVLGNHTARDLDLVSAN